MIARMAGRRGIAGAAAATLAGIAAALLAPPSHAAFAPVTQPAGEDRPIAAFAVSGATWLAVLDPPDSDPFGAASAFVSGDRGASWRPIEFPGRRARAASVGPDGSFWVADTGNRPNEPLLHRLRRGSSSFTTVALPGNRFPSAPSFDRRGRMWVAGGDQDAVTLYRLGEDGSVAQRPTAAYTPHPDFAGPCADPEVVARGRLLRPDSVYVVCPDAAYRLSRGTLRSAPTGVPFWRSRDRRVLLSDTGRSTHVSYDGGRTSHFVRNQQLRPVAGDPAALAYSAGDGEYGDGFLVEIRPGVWGPSALQLTDGWATVQRTAGGYVATDGPLSRFRRPTRITFHRGRISRPPHPTRGLNGTSARILREINRFRDSMGLPPLFGHQRAAEAAIGHSNYLALNGTAGHGQQPGAPGFTGVTFGDRCDAAGASNCATELVGPSIPSLMNAVFHRNAMLNPTAMRAGPGRAEGSQWTVVVMGFTGSASFRSFGYPNGRYTGPLAFLGGESPDPLAECASIGHPLPRGSGTPISFFGPAGSRVVSLSLHRVPTRKRRGSRRARPQAIRGCVLKDDSSAAIMMPGSRMKPNATYRATARWRVGTGPAQTYRWSFRTGRG